MILLLPCLVCPRDRNTDRNRDRVTRQLTTQPDIQHMEGLLPKHHSADAVEIPGARSLLEHLIARSTPWTIVTSGTVPLVTGVCNHPLLQAKQNS